MEAGFASVCINPPLGTPVLWEETGGCEGIHDDIFVRALYLSHDGVDALILGFDVVFGSCRGLLWKDRRQRVPEAGDVDLHRLNSRSIDRETERKLIQC